MKCAFRARVGKCAFRELRVSSFEVRVCRNRVSKPRVERLWRKAGAFRARFGRVSGACRARVGRVSARGRVGPHFRVSRPRVERVSADASRETCTSKGASRALRNRVSNTRVSETACRNHSGEHLANICIDAVPPTPGKIRTPPGAPRPGPDTEATGAHGRPPVKDEHLPKGVRVFPPGTRGRAPPVCCLLIVRCLLIVAC